MKRGSKSFRAIVSLLDEIVVSGTLEQGQINALRRAVKKLDHAVRVRDIRQIEAAVADIAKQFIRLYQ